MTAQKLIVGNWKMTGTLEHTRDLAADLVDCARAQETLSSKLVVCPSFVHLALVRGRLLGSSIALGAQDCAPYDEGAYTGETSVSMLKDVGCSYVILGHSERRTLCGETSAAVQAKAQAAQKGGLTTIICVGETEEEREKDMTLAVVDRQVQESLPTSATAENTVIAYEPVWAIGSGKVPTTLEIEEVHRALRKSLKALDRISILYGGSVNPKNAGEILSTAHVDGALVGGASLKARDFWAIACSR